MTTDLWPEFDVTTPKATPKSIIEEVGRGLKKKTKGLVEFYVDIPSITEGFASFVCKLYSTKLRYMYPFLTVRFPMADDGYPVELVADKMPETLRAANEEELLGMLGKVFQSPSTINTIQQLMSLSG